MKNSFPHLTSKWSAPHSQAMSPNLRHFSQRNHPHNIEHLTALQVLIRSTLILLNSAENIFSPFHLSTVDKSVVLRSGQVSFYCSSSVVNTIFSDWENKTILYAVSLVQCHQIPIHCNMTMLLL